jgi:glycerate dehydrogenase
MVGLVGHGRIGRNVERWLRAFGAGVYWYEPKEYADGTCHSVEWLFRNCHIVVVCCSLTLETRDMIGGNLVRLMRHGAILVNTARGEVLDEDGVAAALTSRQDIEMWTDVLAGEATGQIEMSPLLRMPQVHITPHIAGTTFESQEKAARIALNLTKRWLERANI